MRTTISCAGCDQEVAGPAARWCGRCGHPLKLGEDDRHRSSTRPAPAQPIPFEEAEGEAPTVALDPPASRRSRFVGAAVVALVLGGLLIVQASRPLPGEPHGFTDRGVPARTGVASLEGIATPSAVAWQVPLELPRFTPAGATVRGTAERVYVMDLEGRQGVTAHDATTGAVRWSRPDIPLSEAAPLVAGEAIVVGTRDGGHVALGPDGTEWWSAPEGLGSPVEAAGGIAEVRDHAEVALRDIRTGDRRWVRDLGTELDASPQYVLTGGPDDLVVVLVSRPRGLRLGSNPELETGHLVGLEAASGDIRWEIDLPSGMAWFQSPVAVDGSVAVAASASTVVFWDVATGQRIGEQERRLAFPPMGVGAAAGRALLIEPNGTLASVASDGGDAWSVNVTMPAGIDVRGERVLLSTEHRVTVIDAASGAVTGGVPVDRTNRHGPPGRDGTVYALGSDGRLTAHGPSGGIRFERATLVPAAAAPALADGVLYTATGAGVSVHSSADGARVWEFRTGDPSASIAGDLFSPVVDDEVVIASPPHSQPLEVGGVFALQRATGILAWDRLSDRPTPRGPLTLDRDLAVVPVGGHLHGYAPGSGRRALAAVAHGSRGPVAAGGGLLVSATAAGDPGGPEGRSILAVRRADRGRAWETPVASCTPPSIADGSVLVGTDQGIQALDLGSGAPEWEAGPTLHPVCGDLVVGPTTVVGVAGGVELVAVRLGDGSPAWQRELPDGVAAAPALAGDELLVPLVDGTILGIGMEDGDLRWTMELPGVPASAPVVADGRIVVVLRSGGLVALGPE